MKHAFGVLSDIYHAALKAVDPYESVKRHAESVAAAYRKENCEKLLLVGFGKASCRMAEAVEETLGDLIEQGIVITKYGHSGGSRLRKTKVHEAGHPLPDENGVRATEDVISYLETADAESLVLCLISGGGSALLVSPVDGITLSDKKKVTDLLLKVGADISELNAVRKHISRVKGGRLARLAYPAHVISLILSDVTGNRLDVISSGPTSPDGTTFSDALSVLKKYGLITGMPESVLEVLQKGADGLIPETPKEGDSIFGNVENIIIADNHAAVQASREKALSMGFHAEVLTPQLTGEAAEAGRWLAKKALEEKAKGARDTAVCLITGGETTVTVKGNGLGGRNMELALAFALEIEGKEGIALLSAGTDGTDGPTDAAGAIVDGQTVLKARRMGLDPEGYLSNNDSYHFFRRTGDLFVTGPTGTNVMDIQIMVIK